MNPPLPIAIECLSPEERRELDEVLARFAQARRIKKRYPAALAQWGWKNAMEEVADEENERTAREREAGRPAPPAISAREVRRIVWGG